MKIKNIIFATVLAVATVFTTLSIATPNVYAYNGWGEDHYDVNGIQYTTVYTFPVSTPEVELPITTKYALLIYPNGHETKIYGTVNEKGEFIPDKPDYQYEIIMDSKYGGYFKWDNGEWVKGTLSASGEFVPDKEKEDDVATEETEYIIEPIVVEETEYIIEPIVVEETEYIVEPIVVEETEYIVEPIVVEETEYIIEPIVVEEKNEEIFIVEETPTIAKRSTDYKERIPFKF